MTNLEHQIVHFQEFYNTQLGNDLEKILDNLDSEGLEQLNIVKDIMLDENSDAVFIIMVQDNSYFYYNINQRNKDYQLLINIIKEK